MNLINKVLSIITSYTFLFSLCVFVVVMGISILIVFIINKLKKENKVIGRIHDHREFSEEDILLDFIEHETNSDVYNKFIKPYIKKNHNTFAKALNIMGINLEKINRQILRANVSGQSPEQLAAYKIIGFILGLFIGISAFPFMGILSILSGALIYLLLSINPIQKLDKEHKKREVEIREVLPTYLKLLANATEVGLTIEEAIRRISAKYDCIISDEFAKVENEAKYTNSWIQAVENMAYRNDMEDFYDLANEIKISKEKGVPITDLLNGHAQKIESEKLLRVSESARKKSTTLILPIFLFEFVPLIALIMLPAVGVMMNSF